MAPKILANSPILSGMRMVTRTPDTSPPSNWFNSISISVSVIIPTTTPCSSTTRQPILFWAMIRAASSSVTSGAMVTTSLPFNIMSLTDILERKRVISHTFRLPRSVGETRSLSRVINPSSRLPSPTTGRCRTLFSLITCCASAAGVVGGTITGCRVIKSLTSMLSYLPWFGNDCLKAV